MEITAILGFRYTLTKSFPRLANTAMEPDKLDAFKEELARNFPDMELVYFPLTMSIGTHVGPGGLGIGTIRYHK